MFSTLRFHGGGAALTRSSPTRRHRAAPRPGRGCRVLTRSAAVSSYWRAAHESDPPAAPPPEPTPAPASHYEPEPPKRPSAFWRAVKWPLRKFFKLLYFVGRGARRHRVAAVLTIIVLAALGGATFGLYQYTHPTRTASQTPSGQTAGGDSNVPFTVITQQPPVLPASVIHWLHGHKVFDAHEMWNSLSPQAQDNLKLQNVTEQDLQSQLNQEKAAGLHYDEYIYTGGFAPPGNDANFTVQVVVTHDGQSTIRTWYFVVDPNGQIIVPLDINTLFGQ
jgi:hypothetical protein